MRCALRRGCSRRCRASAQARRRRPEQRPRRRSQMCQGCHGIEGWRTAFPEVYSVPQDRAASTRRTSSRRCRSTRAASAAIRRCARSRRRCPTRTWRISPRTTRSRGVTTASEMIDDHAHARSLRRRRAGARRDRRACAADLEAGKAKAEEVCAACHGIDGNSPTPDYPEARRPVSATTSRRRCATTSPARARTRSWRASRRRCRRRTSTTSPRTTRSQPAVSISR